VYDFICRAGGRKKPKKLPAFRDFSLARRTFVSHDLLCTQYHTNEVQRCSRRCACASPATGRRPRARRLTWRRTRPPSKVGARKSGSSATRGLARATTGRSGRSCGRPLKRVKCAGSPCGG
jgi:hypothetical protein